jgi:hypothetical protein
LWGGAVQEPVLPAVLPSTWHAIYDSIVGASVIIFATVKGIAKAREYGLLPDRGVQGDAAKVVGQLRVESFQTAMRHLLRNEVQAVESKREIQMHEVLEVLRSIDRQASETNIILRERKG